MFLIMTNFFSDLQCDCEILKSVSCTSNLLEQMYDLEHQSSRSPAKSES